MAHYGVLWAIMLAGALVTGGGDLSGPAQLEYVPGAITSLARTERAQYHEGAATGAGVDRGRRYRGL